MQIVAMALLMVSGMVAVSGLTIMYTMDEGNVACVRTLLLFKVWGLCLVFGIPMGIAGYFLAR